ncbi:MAG: DUF4249 family protein [Saprospiraceae bacterium]|nr:DUF4249 family protein [Saprospiraceae bacterium]MBP7680228.1 DUF4249 family protein [Saprospiraceae bacterium]
MQGVRFWAAVFAMLFGIAACNLEKEIEIDLPVYVPQPIVECYLEQGKPIRLLLTKSSAYFDDFDFNNATSLLINDANITITYNGQTIPLQSTFIIDTTTATKFYNYAAADIVPLDYDNPFYLNITLADGQTITAKTQFLQASAIDSTVYDFNTISDTVRARVITYFKDVTGQRNYYRRQLHRNTLDSIPQMEFAFINDFVENGQIAVGSGYVFDVGDTAISTIYRMDETYYEFWKSVTSSQQVSGNPFGQPGNIYKAVGGTANALGIFTTLNYDRDTVIIIQ